MHEEYFPPFIAQALTVLLMVGVTPFWTHGLIMWLILEHCNIICKVAYFRRDYAAMGDVRCEFIRLTTAWGNFPGNQQS